MEKLVTSKGVFLRAGDKVALFQPESMRLFGIDIKNGYTSLCDIAAEITQETDSVATSTSVAIDDSLYLSRRQAILPMMLSEDTLKTARIKPAISRLTLNISNACNLWCAYCYADHGQYHSTKSQMPADQTEAIIERVLTLYSGAEIVHYFGGEPLLNLPAINASGLCLEKAVVSGKIPQLPKFVATTNGTISSDRVIETLKRWGIELTVSWDGPKEIQDSGRPMTGGGSSYQKVIKSLERFQNNSIPHNIECTFNASHIRAGVSIIDLMDFFSERTGQRIFHIAPSSTPEPNAYLADNGQKIFRIAQAEKNEIALDMDTIIQLYRDATRYTVRNFLRGSGPLLEFAHRVIEQVLMRKPSLTYCPAFFNQLSVAADGSVFPCFMFIGDPKFNLGNLLTDEFPTKNGSAVFKRYFEDFGFAPLGTDSWYKGLFGGCVAGDYISTNTLNTRYMAPMYEAIIEECLIELACSEQMSMPLQHEEAVY